MRSTVLEKQIPALTAWTMRTNKERAGLLIPVALT